MFQIINAQAQFTLELKQAITKDIAQYKIIGIMGAQSSGKSTLMNALFNTNFKTMNSLETRKQTTQGIWGQFHENNLILDVEGSDSSNRWGSIGFENQVSLFSLTLSDVLLINIWATDIGRFNSSQYGILQLIMGLCLKEKKSIIIIVRDTSERENLQEIQKVLFRDINKIWNSISQAIFTDYFDLMVYFLPNLLFQEKKFNQQIINLRQLIYQQKNISQKVPLGSLDLYCVQIWNQIINNKDLNLPVTRELVSIIRCDEIIKELLNDLNQYSSLKDMQIKDLVKECEHKVESYFEQTKNYQENVRQRKAEELKTQIKSKHLDNIYRLIDEFRQQIQEAIQKEYQEITFQKLKNLDQSQTSSFLTIQSKYYKIFSDKITQLNILPPEHIKSILVNFQQTLQQLGASIKQQLINNKQQEIIKRVKGQYKIQLEQEFTQFDIQLFNNVILNFKKYQQDATNELKQILDILQSENEIVIQNFQFELSQILTELYKTYVANLQSYALKKFSITKSMENIQSVLTSFVQNKYIDNQQLINVIDYVTKNKDKDQLWFMDYKYIILFMILFSLLDKQLSLLLIAGVVYFKIKK